MRIHREVSAMRMVSIAIAAILCGAMTPASRGGAMYNVTDLTPPPGNSAAIALAINNANHVLVGTGPGTGTAQYYVYDANSGTSLPTTAGSAYAFNDSDQVVSNSTPLAYTGKIAINNLGQIAEIAANGDLAFQTQAGSNDLGTPFGKFSLGGVNAINDSGQIVGYGYASDSTKHPFVYSNGRFTDLGITQATATSINALGQIVGGTAGGLVDPFLYQNGKLTDLGSLGGGYGLALSINNLGQVVGWSSPDASGTQHAFLYQDGKMLDLNDLIPKDGFTLVFAMGINDQGDIIADAVDASGNYHALLLTQAVPEPSSCLIVACGGMAILLHRRRHPKKIAA